MPGAIRDAFARSLTSALSRTKRILRALIKLPKTTLCGLLLVILGIAFLDNYENHYDFRDKLIGLFLSELGFAFLIAVIVFVILEEWAAREHGKTVIGYLYGIHPAGTFFKKIESYVLEQPFYRGETKVDYYFKDEDKTNESLLIEYTIEYKVTNKCRINDHEDFFIRGDFNVKPLHSRSTHWDDELGIIAVEVNGEPQDLSILDIKPDSTRNSQSYIAKEPLSLVYNGSATIKLTHLLVKHDHDSDVWHGSIPSTGVEVKLRWNPVIRLRFAKEAIHPDAKDLTETPGQNELAIRLKQPFLVNHGIHFWWSPV